MFSEYSQNSQEHTCTIWRITCISFSTYFDFAIIHLVRSQNFPKKQHLLPPDMQTYLCVSGGKKCYFFGKFRVRIKWMIPFHEFKKFEIYVVEYHNETWWYISTTYEQHFQHNFSSVLKPGNYFQALLWFHKNVNIIMSVHF